MDQPIAINCGGKSPLFPPVCGNSRIYHSCPFFSPPRLLECLFCFSAAFHQKRIGKKGKYLIGDYIIIQLLLLDYQGIITPVIWYQPLLEILLRKTLIRIYQLRQFIIRKGIIEFMNAESGFLHQIHQLLPAERITAGPLPVAI